ALIKLGQFLSTRVDILPPEVTRELADLQDEIPPEQLKDIVIQIEKDFGRPLSDVFVWFSPEPLGSASLAQAYLARIASGEEVVVKVLRPGIDVLVETDLVAIAQAIRWLKYYGWIRKRVDLDWLIEEFTTVTRNELDLKAEGKNAERFAQDFADDPQVYIPKIYKDYSAALTLTLENVGYLKINDLEALDAVGINRSQVAQKFYHIYMQQIFMTSFVHADPHPGNVFIKPLPHLDEGGIDGFSPKDSIPYKADRPFQIAFVDFGMVAVIPERLRSALREYAIGIGTLDPHKIVQYNVNAGVLLPGADLKRLEEVHEALFERFWGLRIGQLHNVALSEARYFVREYRDIIYEAPFQFQADMLFVLRAVGILSGMATHLDPNFDPWAETIPFAERLAAEELQQDWKGWLQEFAKLGQLLLKAPMQLDRVLTQAQRGNLTVQTSLAPDARKTLQRLEQAVHHLTWTVMTVGLLLAGAYLHVNRSEDSLGMWFMGIA
ncbi:MAG: AarF/UbiB family protein, partial [Nitrospira sp.]|nr:AarF/UbiB family protein [Nitrospira sp.]